MSAHLTDFIDLQISQATVGFTLLTQQFKSNRKLRLVEQEGGNFIQLDNGGDTFSALKPRKSLEELAQDHEIHIELSAKHFLVRQLTLPTGAKSYIQGIIQSQIDRLMPWKSEQTIFGWSLVNETKSELTICIAATKITKVDDLLHSFNNLPAKKIFCQVTLEIENQKHGIQLPIRSMSATPEASSARIRIVLTGFLATAFILYILALAASHIIGSEIDAIQSRLIDVKRQATELTNRNDPILDEVIIASDRKLNERPVVEVLDELAGILPDDTYLTSIAIEKHVIHIEGISADVTNLPALLDGSNFFTGATFSAATKRQQAGDSFRIDASITERRLNVP